MKIIIISKLVFILVIAFALANACPTCVGRVEHNSPAFFADEFYQAQEADVQDNEMIDSTQVTITQESEEESCQS
jgi:hypothetical protein